MMVFIIELVLKNWKEIMWVERKIVLFVALLKLRQWSELLRLKLKKV